MSEGGTPATAPVFMHLNAHMNWYGLFMDLIRDVDIGKLAARQRAALERQGLPVPE